jgi:hypothetical protein
MKEYILPSKKYYNSQEINLTENIVLNNSLKLLRENEINYDINLIEQFNVERQKSNNYRIYGKIKMIFSNSYSGYSTNPDVTKKLYYLTDGTGDYNGYLPYDEFALIRKDVSRLELDDIDFTIDDLGQINNITNVIGDSNVSILDAPYYNWNIHLSYPYRNDFDYPMKYTLSGLTKTEGVNIINFKSNNGFPARVEINNNFYKITSPIPHGLIVGDYVLINGYDYEVYDLGDNIENSEKYVFYINKKQNNITLNNLVTIKKYASHKDKILCDYYVIKNRVLTNYNDVIYDVASFESSIFKEEKRIFFENSDGTNDVIKTKNRSETLFYDFKKPFNNVNYKNNLGNNLDRIFLTIVNVNKSKLFKRIKTGFQFNFHDSWSDNHFLNNSIYENINIGEPLNIDDEIIGQFVEYNPLTLSERVISEPLHKLVIDKNIFNHNQTSSNVYSGATVSNPFGLYYQPNYELKLKYLSNYVETYNGDDIENLPSNSRYMNNKWFWRDEYEMGFIDDNGNGLDYPFMNNSHYLMKSINFFLRNEYSFKNKKDSVKLPNC